MAFRALWQTANRANARLKATLGGFHGPLTFFIENQSFFANSFDLYPIGEKTEVADSEKRTPEVKFRPFLSSFQKITFSQKTSLFRPLVGQGLMNSVLVYCREELKGVERLLAKKAGHSPPPRKSHAREGGMWLPFYCSAIYFGRSRGKSDKST